jgi:hypothetical protein
LTFQIVQIKMIYLEDEIPNSKGEIQVLHLKFQFIKNKFNFPKGNIEQIHKLNSTFQIEIFFYKQV